MHTMPIGVTDKQKITVWRQTHAFGRLGLFFAEQTRFERTRSPSDALSTLYAVIFVVGNKQSFNSPLSDTRSARMIDLISGAGVSCLPKYLRAVIAVIGNT